MGREGGREREAAEGCWGLFKVERTSRVACQRPGKPLENGLAYTRDRLFYFATRRGNETKSSSRADSIASMPVIFPTLFEACVCSC